jgi:hypothetical protein
MPAPVRLFTISNQVNGTCKGAAHITPIFYLPHVFMIEPLTHCRTIVLQSPYFGKWFVQGNAINCSISLYDTTKATRMKQNGTNG